MESRLESAETWSGIKWNKVKEWNEKKNSLFQENNNTLVSWPRHKILTKLKEIGKKLGKKNWKVYFWGKHYFFKKKDIWSGSFMILIGKITVRIGNIF